MSWSKVQELKEAVKEAEECNCSNPRYHLTGNHYQDVKALLEYIEGLEKNAHDLLPF